MTAELIDMQTVEVMDQDTINYDVHPVANLFPYMEGEPFQEFVEDIRVNGQREPVVLDEQGRLIDGRNRARACQQLGVDVKEMTYSGDDVDSWIISHNIHRRHLTESQRAVIAAKLANLSRGNPTGSNQYESGKESIDRIPPTRADAAKSLNVGQASVGRARSVIKSGNDELIKSVESGETSVTAAAEQVRGKARQEDQRQSNSKATEPKKGDPKPSEPKVPRPGPNRRKHKQVIEAMVTGLSGTAIAADDITELDQSVTAEEAARLQGDLSKSIKSFNKINTLLKERTK